MVFVSWGGNNPTDFIVRIVICQLFFQCLQFQGSSELDLLVAAKGNVTDHRSKNPDASMDVQQPFEGNPRNGGRKEATKIVVNPEGAEDFPNEP